MKIGTNYREGGGGCKNRGCSDNFANQLQFAPCAIFTKSLSSSLFADIKQRDKSAFFLWMHAESVRNSSPCGHVTDERLRDRALRRGGSSWRRSLKKGQIWSRFSCERIKQDWTDVWGCAMLEAEFKSTWAGMRKKMGLFTGKCRWGWFYFYVSGWEHTSPQVLVVMLFIAHCTVRAGTYQIKKPQWCQTY